MKVRYRKGIANHPGPESCGGAREGAADCNSASPPSRCRLTKANRRPEGRRVSAAEGRPVELRARCRHVSRLLRSTRHGKRHLTVIMRALTPGYELILMTGGGKG